MYLSQHAVTLMAALMVMQRVQPGSPSCLLAATPSCPNIIFILGDDQAYPDFGFMGNRLVHTPNLDQLARQSARYPNGYVPMSVCRPSLATLLTGLYPHQHGIHFNHPPPGLRAMKKMTAEEYQQARARTDYLLRSVPTLPRILSRNGYVCLQTGKFWEGHYSTAGFTHGMTLGRPAMPRDMLHGTRQQDNGEWVAHGNGDAGLAIGRDTMQPIADFLDQFAGRQPFFIWYAPFLPHAPFDAPARFRELYAGRPVPEYLLPYYAEIARFDETVGQLLHLLEEKKVLRNTLVVFASDNGFRPDKQRSERQDKRSKLSPYENGLRTPILIRWDAHVQPAEHVELVQTVDLVPTVLHAVGLADSITARMQGINLMPSAEGRTRLPDRPAFGAIYPNDAHVLGRPSEHVRARWIRQGDYKLIVPGKADRAIPLSLFDLSKDPDEEVNLAIGQHAARIERMRRQLDDWWAAE